MLGVLRRLHSPTSPHDTQATQLLQQLAARQIEPNIRLRGHDFFPPGDALAQVPSVKAAHLQAPADRVLWLHYFTADCDWFVAGFDPRTGWAFGYGEEPGIDVQDWGWFDLNVMCSVLIACEPPVVVWRDLEWRPQPARHVLAPAALAG